MMSDQPSRLTTETHPELGDLAPSAKLVAKTLEYEGEGTQAQLAESTCLPTRTVRHALSELEAEDVVTSRVSFIDARQQIYSLDGDEQS